MGGRGGGPNASALGQALKKSQATPAVPVAQAQDSAFEAVQQAIAAEKNRVVTTMERVREHLAAQGMTRDRQDAELLRLFRARKIILTPVNNQKMMTPSERDARISVGGELKGLVMVT